MTTFLPSHADRAGEEDPVRGGADGRRRIMRRSAGALAVSAVLLGAVLGQWYLPAVAGVGLGACAAARGLGMLGTIGRALAIGPLAWALALVPVYARGGGAGTDRTVAALAGLPDLGVTTTVLTLLVALAQALTGAWVGRAAQALLRHVRAAASARPPRPGTHERTAQEPTHRERTCPTP